MANAGESVCHNDPNFSVICSFLDKYSELLGLPSISFQDLQRYLEDTKDVSKVLIDLHVWLLRRIGRHSVTAERLDRSLIKFCHWFSDVDAWEVERFGYKHSKLSTKLRILKNLLECQFDNNVKFKDKINELDPESMRFHPIGRDKNGMAYWYLLDQDYNLLVYRDEQDDVDAETWELVCKDRDDLAALISKLVENNDLQNKADETNSSNKSSKEGSPDIESHPNEDLPQNDKPNTNSDLKIESELKMMIKLEYIDEKNIKTYESTKMEQNNAGSENVIKQEKEEQLLKQEHAKLETEEIKQSETVCKTDADKEITDSLKVNNNSDSKTDSVLKESNVEHQDKEDRVAPDKDGTTDIRDMKKELPVSNLEIAKSEDFTTNTSETKPEISETKESDYIDNNDKSSVDEPKERISSKVSSVDQKSDSSSVSYDKQETIRSETVSSKGETVLGEKECESKNLQDLSSLEIKENELKSHPNENNLTENQPEHDKESDFKQDTPHEDKLEKKDDNLETDNSCFHTDEDKNNIFSKAKHEEIESKEKGDTENDLERSQNNEKPESTKSNVLEADSEISHYDNMDEKDKQTNDALQKNINSSGQEADNMSNSSQKEKAENKLPEQDVESNKLVAEMQSVSTCSYEEPVTTRTRKASKKSLSQQQNLHVNGVSENTQAVGIKGKATKRKADINDDVNGKDDSNDKSEISSDDDITKTSSRQTMNKSRLKRSAINSEYKEPAEKKAKRGKGPGRTGTLLRAKRKVTVFDESSDSSDSDDVPLSVIKGQNKAGRVSRKKKGQVRQRNSSKEGVSSEKTSFKSKKTKSSETNTSDESDEFVQNKKGRGSATKRKAPVDQDTDKGIKPRRSLRACVARNKLLAESLSEEEQASSTEASIDSPSPTDSDDEDFFCPKGRNAQRVAARIEQKEFQPGPDDTPCCRCHLCDHPEWMLLCDKCDAGYHTACLRPPLMIIPDGDWFCPPCEHKFLIEKLQEQLASLDVFLKKKARLIKRKERLAFVGISLDNILKEDTKKSIILQEVYDEEETKPPVVQKSRRDKKKERDEIEPLPEEVYAKRSCRMRKTMNYNFTEYDELINSAIQEDIRDVDLSQPPGIGRGKDISNIIQAVEADEEVNGKPPPVLSRVAATKKQRKGRRLTQLDSDDNDDDSEEFQISEESVSEASLEEADEAASDESDDWMPGCGSRRPSARKSSRSSKGKSNRWSSYAKDFVVDDDYESSDSLNNRRSTRSKSRKQVNYQEFNSDESEAVESSESSESASLSDLCSDDSDTKTKKPSRRVIKSESEEEEAEAKSLKKKKIQTVKKSDRNISDSESNEESSSEEKMHIRPVRRSAAKVNFKQFEESSSESVSERESKPVKKKKNVLESDSESENEDMNPETKDEKNNYPECGIQEESKPKVVKNSKVEHENVLEPEAKDTENNVSVIVDSEDNKGLNEIEKENIHNTLTSPQALPTSKDRQAQNVPDITDSNPQLGSASDSFSPQGQSNFPQSYGLHPPQLHNQYGPPYAASYRHCQHPISQTPPSMGSPNHPHASPQHMQGTPPHDIQHVKGPKRSQQGAYPSGAQHISQGYYMQGSQQRGPVCQNIVGACGSPPHGPHSTPPQHPPQGTPPHMGAGHSHISPPPHHNQQSGPSPHGPMQQAPPSHPHQYGPYPNMYGTQVPFPRPGITLTTGPCMSPPISQMPIPTSQQIPAVGPSGHSQLNGPSHHIMPHQLKGPPVHNFQALQRPDILSQGQRQPAVLLESRNMTNPPQELQRHSVPCQGNQFTTMTDSGANTGSQGFMMDNLLKDNVQARKEPTGEEDDLEDVSDIVNYVMNDDYFKDHT